MAPASADVLATAAAFAATALQAAAVAAAEATARSAAADCISAAAAVTLVLAAGCCWQAAAAGSTAGCTASCACECRSAGVVRAKGLDATRLPSLPPGVSRGTAAADNAPGAENVRLSNVWLAGCSWLGDAADGAWPPASAGSQAGSGARLLTGPGAAPPFAGCAAAARAAAASATTSSASAASDCRCRRASSRSLLRAATEAAPTASTAAHSSTLEACKGQPGGSCEGPQASSGARREAGAPAPAPLTAPPPHQAQRGQHRVQLGVGRCRRDRLAVDLRDSCCRASCLACGWLESGGGSRRLAGGLLGRGERCLAGVQALGAGAGRRCCARGETQTGTAHGWGAAQFRPCQRFAGSDPP